MLRSNCVWGAWLLISALPAVAMEMSPLQQFSIDRLEQQEDEVGVLETEYWRGSSTHKMVFKGALEWAKGEIEGGEFSLSYQRAFSPYWDWRVGGWYGGEPGQTRSGIAFDLEGTAPYFIEMESRVVVAEHGDTWWEVEMERELRLDRQWLLVPRVTFQVNGHEDREEGVARGFSDSSWGLRLLHETSRQFHPYIGIEQTRLHGDQADWARLDGEDTRQTRLLIGFSAWF